MKFQLTFDGDLPSVGNSPPPRRPAKVAAIWTVRNAIGEQLESLWQHHHLLRGDGGTQARAAAIKLREPIKRCGYDFVAIVRPVLRLKCELAVNMLVNHSPGSLITGLGDLDNRVKTLLDALRVPKDPQEFKNVTLPAGLYPCLVEDDAMITALHITTDRYLACPSPSQQHVRLQIGVSVLPAENSFMNEAFQTG